MKNHHFAKVLLSCFLCLVMFSSGCFNIGCCSMQAKYERTVQLSAPLSPESVFEAQTHNGSIKINGADVTECSLTATIVTRAATDEEALGMIVTGVLSVDEAYRSVDWMTVFLLAGLIPLGIAFEKTGTAAFIAHGVLALIGQPPPIVMLAVVGIMTSIFTLVISNVGATVLLVPLCMNMAVMTGGDPRMAALVVGLSASNTFILPTHQVNALIMRPGGYSTVDYMRAGAVMTLLFLTVELTVIYFFYGVG